MFKLTSNFINFFNFLNYAFSLLVAVSGKITVGFQSAASSGVMRA